MPVMLPASPQENPEVQAAHRVAMPGTAPTALGLRLQGRSMSARDSLL